MPTGSKGDLLADYLTERGVQLHLGRLGWQKVSCFGPGHAKGDRNPSASVNLVKGQYRCFGCDLSGDVYDLLMAEEGLTYPEARDRLGGTADRKEQTWL